MKTIQHTQRAGLNRHTGQKQSLSLKPKIWFALVALTFLYTGCKPKITISPVVPTDILTGGDSASKATLSEAAIFAWNEFIALNWPAMQGYRDSANAELTFGDTTYKGPLVWHTFRHKVELFPGNGAPPHGYNPALPDYGYNGSDFEPKYFYKPSVTNTKDGHVEPAYTTTGTSTTPWINLDETNEIGVSNMFSGAADTLHNGNMMLYLAKANKAEYVYAAENKWYAGGNGLSQAKTNTKAYIAANSNTPRPGMSNSLVSLPYGTIEVKTAWRKLSQSEAASGRFYANTVRHYVEENGFPHYVDEVYGMMALHIIQKTPTAPYFIFATFEQADNLLTEDGKPVEDEDGNLLRNQNGPALSPAFTVTNAIGSQPMKFSVTTVDAKPGKSLYYKNTKAFYNNGDSLLPDSLQLPLGTVRINRRLNPIPEDIITVNATAHKLIKKYNPNAVWNYYKLINVQHKPINKPTPGEDYHGVDSASYYQSNSVVESDYVLQKFSGRFYTYNVAGYTTTVSGKTVTVKPYTLEPNSITDFLASAGNPPAHNAYNNGKFLMGGCMGCHGNATNGGTDYSFIFGSPVHTPATTRQITGKEALEKMKRYLKNANN